MNTYADVVDRATPGPLTTRFAGNPAGDRTTIYTEDGLVVADTSLSMAVADCGGTLSEEEATANAELLVHCRNNFDKALNELKAWQAAYCEWCLAEDPGKVCFPQSSELIAELEQVKSYSGGVAALRGGTAAGLQAQGSRSLRATIAAGVIGGMAGNPTTPFTVENADALATRCVAMADALLRALEKDK